MLFLPCLPTTSKRPPTGPAWVPEIKHDGYRLIVRRDRDRVRLYTRRGYNWSGRFPVIVHAVSRLKARSVIIDGEAVVCDANGVPSFDMLHSMGHDDGADRGEIRIDGEAGLLATIRKAIPGRLAVLSEGRRAANSTSAADVGQALSNAKAGIRRHGTVSAPARSHACRWGMNLSRMSCRSNFICHHPQRT